MSGSTEVTDGSTTLSSTTLGKPSSILKAVKNKQNAENYLSNIIEKPRLSSVHLRQHAASNKPAVTTTPPTPTSTPTPTPTSPSAQPSYTAIDAGEFGNSDGGSPFSLSSSSNVAWLLFSAAIGLGAYFIARNFLHLGWMGTCIITIAAVLTALAIAVKCSLRRTTQGDHSDSAVAEFLRAQRRMWSPANTNTTNKQHVP